MYLLLTSEGEERVTFVLLVQVTVGVVRDCASQVRLCDEPKKIVTDPVEMFTVGIGTRKREEEN